MAIRKLVRVEGRKHVLMAHGLIVLASMQHVMAVEFANALAEMVRMNVLP